MSKDFIRINKTAISYLAPNLFGWFNNDRKIDINIEDFSSMLDFAKTLEEMQIMQAFADGAMAGASKGEYVRASPREYYEQNFKTKSIYEHYLASKGGRK